LTQSASASAKELCESSSDPRSLAGRPDQISELLGQVLTPQSIARKMVVDLFDDRPNHPVSILDPCMGPSTFPNQMMQLGVASSRDRMTLVDIDDRMISRSESWIAETNASADLVHGDYLEIAMDNQFDFAALNPPFIRQEWIDKKLFYRTLFKTRYGLEIPGTSNLYVYFIAKVLKDLKPGGRFACIVYDSWQFTKYGRWMQGLIETECQSLRIARVEQLPFDNRLIDATLIFGTKTNQPKSGATAALRNSHASLKGNKGLAAIDGFDPLAEVYMTRRGLRLKQVDFFLTDLKGDGPLNATPFLKKVRLVRDYVVPKDHPEAALLVDRQSSDVAVIEELQRRLVLAKTQPHRNVSILTWYKERPRSWMYHRPAPFAPIVFNYYLRNRPRHIFNPSRAYSDNFYGLTPRDEIFPLAILASLNSTAVCFDILTRGRNQGNGLLKIQLFEYREVRVPNLIKCSKSDVQILHNLGTELIERPKSAESTLLRIDEAIAAIFADSRLDPLALKKLLSKVYPHRQRKKGA
jgi:hypothetical protein